MLRTLSLKLFISEHKTEHVIFSTSLPCWFSVEELNFLRDILGCSESLEGGSGSVFL